MNANNLLFEKELSQYIQEKTGIKTFNSFNLENIEGKENKVFLLTNTASEEAIQGNKTMRNSYSLSFIVQADELLTGVKTEDAIALYTTVENALASYPKYGEMGGAMVLSFSSYELKAVYTDTETEFVINFDAVLQF